MACSQLTTIPQGFGFVEDETMNLKKCAVLKVNLQIEENSPFAQAMKRNCCDAKRSKRVVPVVAVGAAVAGKSLAAILTSILTWTTAALVDSTVVLGVIYIIRNGINGKEKKEKFEKLKNLLHDFDENGKINYAVLKKVAGQLSNDESDRILEKLFNKNDLEDVLRFFGVEPIKLLEKLGFNAKLGTDILATFEYTFLCGKSATNYELSVCGQSNPTRQYGEVQLVAPIGGNFVYEGMFYRHYDVPKYAIVTEDKKEMVSAKTCRKIGAHYECQIQKGPCDVNEYKNCNTVMNRVTDNVVAIELGDATFIATTTQNYHLCSKEDKKGVYQVVPPSGHFIFQAPHDQYIEFRGKTVQKFYGRHDKLVINPFNVYEKLGMFETHEELEEWNENQRRVGKGLDTIDMMLLHDIQQSNSSLWDNFIHTVKAHPYWSTFGSMLFVLIVAVFIISIMKWCWRKCRRTRNKGINEKRDQERGFDQTTKEFIGIHNV